MKRTVKWATIVIYEGWEEEVAKLLAAPPEGCIMSIKWTRYSWEDKEEVVTFWYWVEEEE